MTPKEKAVWMLSIYNAQYEDYKMQAERTDLVDAQKDVLREKKKLLVEVYPLINLYSGIAGSGLLPAEDLEAQIVKNLERLLSMV